MSEEALWQVAMQYKNLDHQSVEMKTNIDTGKKYGFFKIRLEDPTEDYNPGVVTCQVGSFVLQVAPARGREDLRGNNAQCESIIF